MVKPFLWAPATQSNGGERAEPTADGGMKLPLACSDNAAVDIVELPLGSNDNAAEPTPEGGNNHGRVKKSSSTESKQKGTAGSGQRSAPVLICAPDNSAADEIAGRVRDAAIRSPKTKNALVIRMYSVKTKEKMVAVAATCPAGENQANSFFSTADYPELCIAPLVSAAYAKSQKRPYGVRDKRYVQHATSLLTWMLTIAGRIGSHPKTDTRQHHMFNILYNKMSSNVLLDDNDWREYTTHKNQLQEHTISLVNVIITTVSNCRDAPLYSSFWPKLVIVNEATRATKPDMWNVLGHYPNISLVMVGDKAQLSPAVLSDKKTNSFWRPLRLLFFQRLKVLGQPSVLLNEQYRMVESIGTIVSKLFYSNLLSNAPSIAIQSRPRLQRIIQYLSAVYLAKTPVILLAVSGTKMQDANWSRFNSNNASAAMNLSINMVSRGMIRPRDLLIMTLYCAQFRLYRQSI